MRAGSILSPVAALLLACMAMAPGQAAADPDAEQDEREIETLKAAAGAPLTPDDALDPKQIGQRIRWAGGVYSLSPSERGVCLTILYARSGEYGEPRWTPEPTYQNFVACAEGSYDPELVHDYTNVTIVGTITGKRYIGMGGGGSEGPVVTIERLYRWSDCLAGDDSAVCRHGFLEPVPIGDGVDANGSPPE